MESEDIYKELANGLFLDKDINRFPYEFLLIAGVCLFVDILTWIYLHLWKKTN